MAKQLRPVPTKVTLERDDTGDVAYIRVYAENVRHGYFNVDAVPLRTGACIPNLRKKAKAHAKGLKVPFTDLLGPTSGAFVRR